MHQRIQKRKLNSFLRQLLLPALLFCLTLLVCTVIFHPWTAQKVIAPLSQKVAVASPQDQEGEKVREFCNEKHLDCTISRPDGVTIQISMKNNEIVLVSTQKNIASQLSSLQLTMNQLTIEGKQFKKLDFRFDSVVITF